MRIRTERSRTERRDRKRAKRRHGMRVSRSAQTLALIKRDRDQKS